MKINRCPKCGKVPVSTKEYADMFFCGYKIECLDCGLNTGYYAAKSKAVAKWNELTNKMKGE